MFKLLFLLVLAAPISAQTCYFAPTVRPISPANNSTITGSVLIRLDATPNCPNRPVHVKVGIDLGATFPPCSTIPDSCVGEDLTAPGPYAVVMDTTRWANGVHQVWVEALDSFDASASYTLYLDIENPWQGLDTQAPEAFIQLPRDGFTFGNGPSSVTVEGSYADNVAVTQVDLLVNGQLYASAFVAPYSITFSTKKRGTYALQTRAGDAAGNFALSQTITVTK